MSATLTSSDRGRKASRFLRTLSEEERRVHGSIPAVVDYVRHPSFSLPDAEEDLFGRPDKDADVPPYVFYAEAFEDGRPSRAGRSALSPEAEKRMFLQYNYAKHRLSRLLAAQRRCFSVEQARQAIAWQKRAMGARARLAQANLALVPTMAKRSRIADVEFAELISEGNMAVLRSIEKFDVSRGFKFSTYACRAILKSFHRQAAKTSRYRRVFPFQFEPEMERSDLEQQRHERQRADCLDTLRDVLARNHADLSRVETKVIAHRFPATLRRKPKTLAELSRMLKVSSSRVQQIEKQAIAKIRAAFSEKHPAA